MFSERRNFELRWVYHCLLRDVREVGEVAVLLKLRQPLSAATLYAMDIPIANGNYGFADAEKTLNFDRMRKRPSRPHISAMGICCYFVTVQLPGIKEGELVLKK